MVPVVVQDRNPTTLIADLHPPTDPREGCKGTADAFLRGLWDEFAGGNAVGVKFLRENQKKEGVVSLPSGLQYKMDLVDGPRDRDILVPKRDE